MNKTYETRTKRDSYLGCYQASSLHNAKIFHHLSKFIESRQLFASSHRHSGFQRVSRDWIRKQNFLVLAFCCVKLVRRRGGLSAIIGVGLGFAPPSREAGPLVGRRVRYPSGWVPSPGRLTMLRRSALTSKHSSRARFQGHQTAGRWQYLNINRNKTTSNLGRKLHGLELT